jgi:pimeloyl-ACP methyl ester carboxylesterase
MPYINDIYYIKSQGADVPKTPIILIHGVGGTHLSWPAKIRRLPGYDVYAIDLPGHGKSKGTAAQTIQQYIPILINFLAGLGVYRAVFIGHSMGSAIAMQLALDEPDHTAGIGIIAGAASYHIGTGFLQEFRSALTLPVALQKLKKQLSSTSAAQNVLEEKPLTESAHPSLWYTDWRACARFDIRDRLSQIKQPAFIAAGRLDQVVPFQSSAFLANQIPQAVLMDYKNSGHLLALEEPDQLSMDIQQFLNTHYV